jgi:hypothetical protein
LEDALTDKADIAKRLDMYKTKLESANDAKNR